MANFKGFGSVSGSLKRGILVGDWAAIQKFVENMPRYLKMAGNDIALTAATMAAGELKRLIRQKGMIDTGAYIKETNAYQDEDGIWYAGVRDVRHPGRGSITIEITDSSGKTSTATNVSGPMMRTLSGWLEYGTVKMQARPHYRIVYANVSKILRAAITRRGFKFLGGM